MKKYFLRFGVLILTLALVGITSCSKDEVDEIDSVEEVNFTHLPKDILAKVKELGLNPADFDVVENVGLDGSKSLMVIVDDAMISKERFLKTSVNDEVSKQYRTEHIVDTEIYDTISIFAVTGNSSFALSETAQEGVRDAIENWNNVFGGSTIKFKAFFSGNPADYNTEDFDILITVQPNFPEGAFSGRAEFPTEDGHPGPLLNISTTANGLNVNSDAIEHLITHELGHAIGFRHTDWDTRASCVRHGVAEENEREPDAIYIFGTFPTFFVQEDSIMNACFGATDGELSFWDETALRRLYR